MGFFRTILTGCGAGVIAKGLTPGDNAPSGSAGICTSARLNRVPRNLF